MKSKKQINAIFPGTFDPITFGHLDIIKQASEVFDKIFIIVGKNTTKNNLFTPEERLNLVNAAIKEFPNCNALIHNGLTVEIAKELHAKTIIRGIRAASCFNKEMAGASKADDDINILVIPAEYMTTSEVIATVRIWIATEFKSGRYEERLQMIENIEENEMK